MEFLIDVNLKKAKGVYIIRNSIDKNVYIGSTNRSFYERYKGHLNSLKNKKHGNPKLQNFVNKYGIEVLSFHLCAIKHETDNLVEIEQYFIDYYSCVKFGFNICPMAQSRKFREYTKEQRDASSRALKKYYENNIEARERQKNITLAAYEKDPLLKLKISESLKKYNKENPQAAIDMSLKKKLFYEGNDEIKEILRLKASKNEWIDVYLHNVKIDTVCGRYKIRDIYGLHTYTIACLLKNPNHKNKKGYSLKFNTDDNNIHKSATMLDNC